MAKSMLLMQHRQTKTETEVKQKERLLDLPATSSKEMEK